jgi:hypothetical protein
MERILGPYRQRLHEHWRRQVEYARTDPEAAFEGSETEYVMTYAANLMVTYQSRAVRALSEIGTPEAMKAIADAHSRVTDPRVKNEIDKALKRGRSPRAGK